MTKTIVQSVKDAINSNSDDIWQVIYYNANGFDYSGFIIDSHIVKMPDFRDYNMMCNCEQLGAREFLS